MVLISLKILHGQNAKNIGGREMSRKVDASPPPKAHIEALSKIGYDFNTAIADIIDNSISAKSKNIQIGFYKIDDVATCYIADDGVGMTESELITNMSIGCKDPTDKRTKGDLGRFGAGLKTASFSQASILSVISKTKSNPVAAAVWDKAVVAEFGWMLEVLDTLEIKNIIPTEYNHFEKGTIVRWDNIWAIQEVLHSPDKQLQIDELCTKLHSYIGLYFHRFLSKPHSITIKINNRPVVAIDPFMRNIKGSEELASTSLRGGKYGKDKLEITAYRLPFFTNMTQSQLNLYGGESSIRQNQGLYVYREERLIVAGGWMGLQKNLNLAGLARIQVDIPASLDNEWSTDVKKSSLQIPHKVKQQIRRLLSKPVAASRGAYVYRGKQEVENHFWLINHDERNDRITYTIDSKNLKLRALMENLDNTGQKQLALYLLSLAETIPVNHIYAAMGNSLKSISQDASNDEKSMMDLIASLNDE
jgi:hypothetical protein